MKTVLCFGDSNTWGYVPGTDGERFAFDVRWPGVVQRELGNDFHIIEEGLNGRTTVWEDPMMSDRNGRLHLPMLLDSHAPIDLVIIMLGTNDLKHYFHLSAHDIALGAGALVDLVAQSPAGRPENRGVARPVLLVSPAAAIEPSQPFGHKFDESVVTAAQLGAAYAEIADEKGCYFFDASQVATGSTIDGIHLDESAHRALGLALAKLIPESVLATG